jgi:hypothetical protein
MSTSTKCQKIEKKITINVIQHDDRLWYLRLFYNGAFSTASKNDLDDQNLLLATVHLHPYKYSLVQQLLRPDFFPRIIFCRWQNNDLLNNDTQGIRFFTDEAWFRLSVCVTLKIMPLHPIKIGLVPKANYRPDLL